MGKQKTRKDFMGESHKEALKDLPRTHGNCKTKTGVFRPGKTAQDRARRENG